MTNHDRHLPYTKLHPHLQHLTYRDSGVSVVNSAMADAVFSNLEF